MPFGRKRKTKRELVVPMDSLSDIAFLLIIFFILTTSIRRLTGFTQEMPATQSTPQQQQTEKTPTVRLHGGVLRMNDQVVDVPALRAKLAAMNLPAKQENDRVIILETGGRVPYEQYYEVMAAISAAGGVVGILAEEEGKE